MGGDDAGPALQLLASARSAVTTSAAFVAMLRCRPDRRSAVCTRTRDSRAASSGVGARESTASASPGQVVERSQRARVELAQCRAQHIDLSLPATRSATGVLNSPPRWRVTVSAVVTSADPSPRPRSSGAT